MAAKCPGMKLGLELRQVAGKPVGGIPQSMIKQIVQTEASPVEMVFIEPDGMISAHMHIRATHLTHLTASAMLYSDRIGAAPAHRFG